MERMISKIHQTSSVFSHRSNLVQRKCACGGVAGFDDLCEQCRSQQLSGQRSVRNSLEPPGLASLGHDAPGTPYQPIKATPPLLEELALGMIFVGCLSILQ